MQLAHRNRLSYLACVLRSADELTEITIVSYTTMLSQIIGGLAVSINGT